MTQQLYILLDVLIATILAGSIGIERELKSKPAGLRTNMIVGGASCLLVSLTSPLIDFAIGHETAEIIRTDPIRVIEALVVGIGFIGGGTILKRKSEDDVYGLTTAATLLYSTGLGIAVALKQYIIAVGVTVLIFVINFIMEKISDRFFKKE